MRKYIILGLIFCGSYWITQAQNSTATYSVVFESNWSQNSHPHPNGNFPSNAHWSKLVGATHNDNTTFLAMGEVSSLGIENIAESGSNTVFFSEINTEISNGTGYSLIDGPGLNNDLGTISIDEITTTNEFPLLSLVSMIAPSPDWIIAINSISLLDSGNDWINEMTLDLYPYDAGTDSGTDYSSSNMDTNPQEPISSLQGVFPFSSEKIGTITITLEEVILGVEQNDLNDSISIYPNPADDYLTISNNNTGIETIQLYSVLGNNIFEKTDINSLSESINISNLPSGIYLLKVIDSEKRNATKRIIKR